MLALAGREDNQLADDRLICRESASYCTVRHGHSDIRHCPRSDTLIGPDQLDERLFQVVGAEGWAVGIAAEDDQLADPFRVTSGIGDHGRTGLRRAEQVERFHAKPVNQVLQHLHVIPELHNPAGGIPETDAWRVISDYLMRQRQRFEEPAVRRKAPLHLEVAHEARVADQRAALANPRAAIDLP